MSIHFSFLNIRSWLLEWKHPLLKNHETQLLINQKLKNEIKK
jgi:hypothetical protein